MRIYTILAICLLGMLISCDKDEAYIDWNDAYAQAADDIAASIQTGRYDQGILVFETVRQLPISDSSLTKARVFNNVAACYAQMYFPQVAYDLLDTVLRIDQRRKSLGVSEGVGLAMRNKAYSNQGNVRMIMSMSVRQAKLNPMADALAASSIERHRESLDLIGHLADSVQESLLANTFNNMGLAFLQGNQLDSAMIYHLRAKAIRPPAQDDGTDLDNIGQVYLEQGEYDLAIANFEAAIEKYLPRYGPTYYLTEPLTKIGIAHAMKGEHQTALSYYQQALTYLSYDFESTAVWDNPAPEKAANLVVYLNVLNEKAKSLWEIISTNNQAELEQLIPTYEIAFELMDQLRKQAFNDQVTYLVSGIGNELTDGFLRLHQQVPNLEQAFRFVERNRANFLLRGIQNSASGSMKQLSETLKAEERSIDTDIRGRRDSLHFFSKSGADSSTIAVIADRFELSLQQKDSLIDRIRKEAPAYYSFRYDPLQGGIQSVQEMLEADEVLLEYFWGQEQLYTFRITAEDYELLVQPIDSMEAWIDTLFQRIKKPHIDPQTNKLSYGFAPLAHQLYDQLLGKAIPQDKVYARVIIVPDGPLATIPFGVLLKQPLLEDQIFRRAAFAIKDHSFVYAYSSGVLTHQAQLDDKFPRGSNNLLAVAPFAGLEERRLTDFLKTYGPLVFSEQEIQQIENVDAFETKSLMGKAANLPAFLRIADQYPFLHLATHAQANSDFPDSAAVVFAPDPDGMAFWWSKDIATSGLSPAMLVLSACETGYGKTISGEGNLSLARAFSISGAQSVLASLWSINDQMTADLISEFYASLNIGAKKDIALRQAQVKMIEEGNNIDFAHPYYWAAFTLIGDWRSI